MHQDWMLIAGMAMSMTAAVVSYNRLRKQQKPKDAVGPMLGQYLR